MTPLSVVTWKWGRTFSARYVNILRAMLERHLHVPHTLTCITDDPAGLRSDIRPLPLPELFADTIRCRRRLWQFDVACASLFGPRMLCLDLDIVIVDDITPLVLRPEPIVAWYVGYAQVYSPAFLLVQAGALHGLFKAFNADPVGYPQRTGQKNASDLAMLNFYLKTHPPIGRWTDVDGIVPYFGAGYERHEHHGIGPTQPDLPKGARVVMLGGADLDVLEQGRFPWVRQFWVDSSPTTAACA